MTDRADDSAAEGAGPVPPGLYLVGTPIGNLEDISLRALRILRGVDLILAEDTRRTRKLLSRYDIHTRLLSCHRFNEERRVAQAVAAVREGRAVALVSDAGMPGISDPGSRLAWKCRQAGVPVSLVPGPCSVLAALVLSGAGGGEFHFAGFLPHRGTQRRRKLAELLRQPHPVVLFESPHRFRKFLSEVAELAAERRLFVARELTKRHEECLEGTAAELQAQLVGAPRPGEYTVVILPPEGDRERLR